MFPWVILQLHLNPVHTVVQLRPSFEHLNSGGPKRKINVRADPNVKSEEHTDVNSAGGSRKQVIFYFFYSILNYY